MILTVLNFAAEEVHTIKASVESGDISRAQKSQDRLRILTEFVENESKNER